MELTQKLGAAAGAVALSLGASALAQDAVQWRVEDGGNGHWYLVVPNAAEQRAWEVCRAESTARGGHLVTLSSGEENAFVASFALQFGWAWSSHPDGFGPLIGGYQVTGSAEPSNGWRWVTEESWDFTNWSPGEPNNSGCGTSGGEGVLAFTARSGVWNDIYHTPASCVGWIGPSFIVEFDADCNSDGIVDFGQILAGELDDANRNNIPDCCEGAGSCNCPGDVARDGVVNGIDLAAVLNNWGTGGGAINADANGDGIVDAEDLALVLGSWGECP